MSLFHLAILAHKTDLERYYYIVSSVVSPALPSHGHDLLLENRDHDEEEDDAEESHRPLFSFQHVQHLLSSWLATQPPGRFDTTSELIINYLYKQYQPVLKRVMRTCLHFQRLYVWFVFNAFLLLGSSLLNLNQRLLPTTNELSTITSIAWYAQDIFFLGLGLSSLGLSLWSASSLTMYFQDWFLKQVNQLRFGMVESQETPLHIFAMVENRNSTTGSPALEMPPLSGHSQSSDSKSFASLSSSASRPPSPSNSTPMPSSIPAFQPSMPRSDAPATPESLTKTLGLAPGVPSAPPSPARQTLNVFSIIETIDPIHTRKRIPSPTMSQTHSFGSTRPIDQSDNDEYELENIRRPSPTSQGTISCWQEPDSDRDLKHVLTDRPTSRPPFLAVDNLVPPSSDLADGSSLRPPVLPSISSSSFSLSLTPAPSSSSSASVAFLTLPSPAGSISARSTGSTSSQSSGLNSSRGPANRSDTTSLISGNSHGSSSSGHSDGHHPPSHSNSHSHSHPSQSHFYQTRSHSRPTWDLMGPSSSSLLAFHTPSPSESIALEVLPTPILSPSVDLEKEMGEDKSAEVTPGATPVGYRSNYRCATCRKSLVSDSRWLNATEHAALVRFFEVSHIEFRVYEMTISQSTFLSLTLLVARLIAMVIVYFHLNSFLKKSC